MPPMTAPVVAPAALEHIKQIEAGSTPTPSGGLTSILLFGLIAALMSTDLAIEFRRGVPMALQTFELLIFVSALAGIAFHWWKRIDEQRRADQELAIVRAEAHRWSE